VGVPFVGHQVDAGCREVYAVPVPSSRRQKWKGKGEFRRALGHGTEGVAVAGGAEDLGFTCLEIQNVPGSLLSIAQARRMVRTVSWAVSLPEQVRAQFQAG
jgi:hypothetical protein